MFNLDLEKAEETEIKLPTSVDSYLGRPSKGQATGAQQLVKASASGSEQGLGEALDTSAEGGL